MGRKRAIYGCRPDQHRRTGVQPGPAAGVQARRPSRRGKTDQTRRRALSFLAASRWMVSGSSGGISCRLPGTGLNRPKRTGGQGRFDTVPGDARGIHSSAGSSGVRNRPTVFQRRDLFKTVSGPDEIGLAEIQNDVQPLVSQGISREFRIFRGYRQTNPRDEPFPVDRSRRLPPGSPLERSNRIVRPAHQSPARRRSAREASAASLQQPVSGADSRSCPRTDPAEEKTGLPAP